MSEFEDNIRNLGHRTIGEDPGVQQNKEREERAKEINLYLHRFLGKLVDKTTSQSKQDWIISHGVDVIEELNEGGRLCDER